MLSRLHFPILLLLAALFLGGCASQKQTERVYVTQRDVPTEPSFTVLPATNRLYQVEWANRIEGSLIDLGVSVTSRPGATEVRKEKTATTSDMQGQEDRAVSKEGEVKVVREYRVRDLDSEYAVRTYASSGQVRIIEVGSREVVASFSIDPDLPNNLRERGGKDDERWNRAGDSVERGGSTQNRGSIEGQLYQALTKLGLEVRNPNNT